MDAASIVSQFYWFLRLAFVWIGRDDTSKIFELSFTDLLSFSFCRQLAYKHSDLLPCLPFSFLFTFLYSLKYFSTCDKKFCVPFIFYFPTISLFLPFLRSCKNRAEPEEKEKNWNVMLSQWRFLMLFSQC